MQMEAVQVCERFQIALLPSVYGLEFAVALAGNVFALWLLVVRERGRWHSGVVLSWNLAVGDLLYVLTLPLLIVYYSLHKHWVFGNAACKLERFLFNCNLYVSIFFSTAISVNRCVALACPFFTRTHIRPAHVKVTSVIIWVLVGLMSCPVLKFASVCQSVEGNNTVCGSTCDGRSERSHFTYRMVLTVCACLVPFVVTLASYCVVLWVVWNSVSITALEKRKVALLVASVLVLYAISFVPYHVLQTYHYHLKLEQRFDCAVYKSYQVTKGLATLNMCVHPLLYMAVLDSIRVACCGRSPEDNRG